jgi:hypothetical protein
MSWQNHIREPLTQTNPLALTEGLLSNLVGVESIKERVRDVVITNIEGQKTARLRGLHHTPAAPVWLLVGNPGTGKTTIASTVAQVFVAVGLATNPTIVHLRKTAIPSSKTGAFFERLGQRVQNGVLIVDELQNYSRCTSFTQFLVAQTDKGLVGRPVVILMGYPAPRKPNVEAYLRKSDSGLARRITDTLVVPNFTPDLVTRVLVDKLNHAGYQLDPAVRLQEYVGRIPPRFYGALNGALAEKIEAEAAGLQAKVLYAGNVNTLEERLMLSEATMRRAVERVVDSLMASA